MSLKIYNSFINYNKLCPFTARNESTFLESFTCDIMVLTDACIVFLDIRHPVLIVHLDMIYGVSSPE